MSLVTGCIPTHWKKSMVVPTPKNSNNVRHPQPTITQSHYYTLLVNFLSVMFSWSFYLTSKLITHSPQSSGDFLRAVRPSLLFSTASMNGSKLLRMERSLQHFFISRKRSTQCLIHHLWQNYSLLDLMNYIMVAQQLSFKLCSIS